MGSHLGIDTVLLAPAPLKSEPSQWSTITPVEAANLSRLSQQRVDAWAIGEVDIGESSLSLNVTIIR
jgi:hypothetical protein